MGASGLAFVAAEEPLPDVLSLLWLEGAGGLYGQVGNAQARIEVAGAADRAGWTDVDAARARATVVRRGWVRRKLEAGEDLAEKVP